MTGAYSGDPPQDIIELGRIVAAYGVQGWVKIQPYSSQAEVLLQTKDWWLKAPAPLTGGAGAFALVRTHVTASRPQGATVVARLDTSPDRNAAEALKGHTIWVSRALFPSEGDDEYYWIDLIGCLLYGLADDGAQALIGQVASVSDNGAHAVLHVARARVEPGGELTLLQNQKGRNIEVLVPFVQAYVHTVDIAAKRLESDWPADF